MKKIVVLLLLLCGVNFTFTQTAYRFRNYTINDGLSQSSVTTILQDDKNALWVGTQDGLNRFDGKMFEVFTSDNTKGIESQYITCSVKTADGKLWFGTTNGLTLFDPYTELFTTFTFGLANALHITSLCLDVDEKIWLGTVGNGLMYFNRITKKFQKPSFRIPTRNIQSVFISKTGELLLNTDDKGLFVVNSARSETTYIPLKSKSTNPVVVQKIVQC